MNKLPLRVSVLEEEKRNLRVDNVDKIVDTRSALGALGDRSDKTEFTARNSRRGQLHPCYEHD